MCLPERCTEPHMQKPVDLRTAKKAVARFQKLLASNAPLLDVCLAVDKEADVAKANCNILDCFGVYVFFYPTGKVARVGEANGTLKGRLKDYEPDRFGWFDYRWI